MVHWNRVAAFALIGLLMASGSARAQQTPPPPIDDPDLDLSFEQPDFSLVTLPTTLRLPRYKSAFRMTHRFNRADRKSVV